MGPSPISLRPETMRVSKIEEMSSRAFWKYGLNAEGRRQSVVVWAAAGLVERTASTAVVSARLLV